LTIDGAAECCHVRRVGVVVVVVVQLWKLTIEKRAVSFYPLKTFVVLISRKNQRKIRVFKSIEMHYFESVKSSFGWFAQSKWLFFVKF
jgi:hypothetical protein